MTLLLNDDQREFQHTLRSVFEKQADSKRVRAVQAAGTDFDREAWAALVELGATTTLIPEEFDGLGLGLTEASLVLEEAGRAIAPVPLYSAILGAAAISAIDDDALKAELLPKIAAGELLVTLAFTEAADAWIPTRPQVSASAAGVAGTKTFVRDGQFADLLLVLTADGLVLVDANAEGVTRTPLGVLDASVFAARVEFNGAAGRAVAVADLDAFLTEVDAIASVLLAAGQYGAYQRELEITTQYAKDRFQFGRSIGSFQGVKFPLADMAMEAELAYGILRNATSLGDAGSPDFVLEALTAQVKLQAMRYAGGAWMARLHGGIGFTWEHDSHLFIKQAKTSQLLLGTPGNRTERLATALGI